LLSSQHETETSEERNQKSKVDSKKFLLFFHSNDLAAITHKEMKKHAGIEGKTLIFLAFFLKLYHFRVDEGNFGLNIFLG